MNIFFLHKDPTVIPSLMSNKHVVKMIVESAQLLCTAIRVIEGDQITVIQNERRLKKYVHPTLNDVLYKSISVNHPCSIWVRSNKKHFYWLLSHLDALCKEYTNRFGKTHLTEKKMSGLLHCPEEMPDITFYDPPLAMPEIYMVGDCIQSYRKYYEKEKLFSEQDKERFFKVSQEIAKKR